MVFAQAMKINKLVILLLSLLVFISLTYATVIDDDGDGVPDGKDECDSWKGTGDSKGAVDTFGCDCDQKSSNDCKGEWCCNVTEGLEKCVVYDFSARCTGDLDGDGIYDIFDKCGNTKEGAVVDSSGCSCLQKRCDDDNLCTDNYCNSTNADCYFFNNNSNFCGEGRKCENGLCTWDEDDGFSEVSYWSYDRDRRELRIFYSHSGHKIEILFEEPFEEDVVILDSTSDVVSYDLNEDKTKLTLLVEGDPSVRGVTTIKTLQKPSSVTIDEVEIVEIKEKASPRNHIWVYFILILIILALILVLILSQRKHEEKMASSIRKEETKIEREVDLEAELQLKMYIITNLRRGYTAKQIKNELLRDGWKKDMVDRAFNSLRR